MLAGRLVALAVLVSGCGSTPSLATAPSGAASAAVEAAPGPRVAVEVHEDVAADRWVVTYTFAAPVMGVAFARGATFRAERWTASTDGDVAKVAWVMAPGPRVVASGSTPLRSLTLAFATDTEEKTADYLVNLGFSDGGRGIYTGYLAVDLLACPDAKPCTGSEATNRSELEAADTVWSFSTDANRGVVVLDARGEGKLTWRPTTLDPADGTYAYFGRAAVRSTPYAGFLIDDGFPEWMVKAADAWIPKLLDHFAARTTVTLADKPLLLLSYGGAEASGRSAKGGGLPGLAQLAVSGQGWTVESEEVKRAWLLFLGHELFHRWNGAALRPKEGAREAWLGEGSSDYFARRALLDLGALPADAYRARTIDAANACLGAVGPKPLLGWRGPDRPEYTCGATLFAMADVLVRAHGATAWDVFGAALHAAEKRSDKSYDSTDVLGEVARTTGDPRSTEPLRRVLEEGLVSGLDELFASGLRAADFPVTLVAPNDAGLEAKAATKEVAKLLAWCDCDGRWSFRASSEGIDFADIPECHALRGIRVVSVEGQAIPARSLDALGALLARDDERAVTLGVAGQSKPITMTCIAAATLPNYQALLR